MLCDLVEHFSSLELTVAALPEEEPGNGYEYLINKFADDSGHTAAEFYTNRTVVNLLTEMIEPKSGESIYDPACGCGGMLLSAIAHLRRTGQPMSRNSRRVAIRWGRTGAWRLRLRIGWKAPGVYGVHWKICL
ncbi:MAG: hypothetical protein A3H35_17600 [Betaproteobacteria bacterium RIFCSPLOWO2_02_FULL_62_17]|nr:MAG: hypothetical protein A3H35_17600 [Betaproteobacteria bacterium RIFCSPLOWO2_02_FULL_62_17]